MTQENLKTNTNLVLAEANNINKQLYKKVFDIVIELKWLNNSTNKEYNAGYIMGMIDYSIPKKYENIIYTLKSILQTIREGN